MLSTNRSSHPSLLKSAASTPMPIGFRRFRHEEIHQAVVVDVRGDHTERLTHGPFDRRAAAGFGKGAVALDVKRQAAGGFENAWYAVVRRCVVSSPRV